MISVMVSYGLPFSSGGGELSLGVNTDSNCSVFFFFFHKAVSIIMLMVQSLLRLRRFGSFLWYLVSVGKGMGGGEGVGG